MIAPKIPATTYPRRGETTCKSGIRIRFIRGLFFPKHQVLQKRMVRCEARNRKPGKAVTYPALQDQAANKRRWPSRSHTKHRGATALFKHLPRSERRIALANHAVMMRGVRRRVMQQIAIQSFNP